MLTIRGCIGNACSKNRIGDAGATALADAVRDRPAVEWLRLE